MFCSMSFESRAQRIFSRKSEVFGTSIYFVETLHSQFKEEKTLGDKGSFLHLPFTLMKKQPSQAVIPPSLSSASSSSSSSSSSAADVPQYHPPPCGWQMNEATRQRLTSIIHELRALADHLETVVNLATSFTTPIRTRTPSGDMIPEQQHLNAFVNHLLHLDKPSVLSSSSSSATTTTTTDSPPNRKRKTMDSYPLSNNSNHETRGSTSVPKCGSGVTIEEIP